MLLAQGQKKIAGGLVTTAPHIDVNRAYRLRPSLVRRVQNYDRDLVIYHSAAIGAWGIGRWTARGLQHIAMWVDGDGTPLPLDDRIFHAIVSWDLRPPTLDAPKSAAEVAAKAEEEFESREAKKQADFAEDMRHLTRANRNTLARAVEGAL